MVWALCLLVAAIAAPFVIEALRKPLDGTRRDEAPGQFVKLPQGMTHFQWYGPDNGPVAICIHGLTTPSFVWRAIAEDLAKVGFRVLTYDHYGRGFSDRPRAQQDRAFFLKHLNDLLESQGIQDDITVLGYSMGGAVATSFAAQHPTRIRQSILLTPAGMLPVAQGWWGKLITTPGVGRWMMLALYPHILRKGLHAEAQHPSSMTDINSLQRKELEYRGFLPSVHRSLCGYLTYTLKKDHGKLEAANVPVLAIWGGADTVIPIAAKDIMAGWNPKAQHHVVQGAGHNVTYSHHDEVMAQIKTFVQTQD